MQTARASDPAFVAWVERHLGRVYHFCYRMTLDHGEAAEAAFDAFRRAYLGERPRDESQLELWLLRHAAQVIEQRLPPTPDVSFDLLDETLRSEATRTGEVSSLTRPERELLLWELKQGCMTA